ncbi:MAG: hypothetical protein Q8P15_03545 [Nanoarchaeota archaeon]|nr:hypothetical protein [Nanoarchaeota archaeon]
MNGEYFGIFNPPYSTWGYVPEKRIIFEKTIEELFKHNKLLWNKERLNELIENQKVIVGRANVLFRQHGAVPDYHTQKAYQFKESAEEWEEIVFERQKAFDFSEVD